jgi:hypothetical protein
VSERDANADMLMLPALEIAPVPAMTIDEFAPSVIEEAPSVAVSPEKIQLPVEPPPAAGAHAEPFHVSTSFVLGALVDTGRRPSVKSASYGVPATAQVGWSFAAPLLSVYQPSRPEILLGWLACGSRRSDAPASCACPNAEDVTQHRTAAILSWRI